MSRRTILTAVTIALFTFSGQATRAEEIALDDEQKIRAVLTRFVESWNAQDAERAVLVYTDPHIDVNATPQQERRQDTIRKFRQYFDRFDTTVDVTSDEIVIFGDYAVQRGEYTLISTPKSGGDTEVIKKRYVELLRKGESGDWLVYWGIDASLADVPVTDRDR